MWFIWVPENNFNEAATCYEMSLEFLESASVIKFKYRISTTLKFSTDCFGVEEEGLPQNFFDSTSSLSEG